MTDLAIEVVGAGPDPAAVLVVDDNADKRLAIRAMLGPLGHAVVEADSGRAALRCALGQTFAVILMDVRMPAMDGYETADLIRRRHQSELTPIIFMTAFGRDETETVAAYARGAVDFIFTPIVAEVLRAKISAFVDLFAQAQALQRSVEAVTALNVALRDSELRARAVLQNVADGIVTAGEDGLIESFNRSARRLFGYREDEVVGKPLQLIIAPSRRGDFSAAARPGLLPADDVLAEPVETVGCRKDGSSFAMEMDISRMQIGEQAMTIGCVRDISGRKAYTEALEHRTLHDDLTGLPNRTLFADRLDRSIAVGDLSGEVRGVLLLALEDFPGIRQVLDRERGDKLLREVADRLREAMPDSATLGRLSAHEFGILPFGETDVATAAVVAWRVRDALEEPFVVGGRALAVAVSIGIALWPEHGRASADLMRRAGLAMHDARRSDSGVAVFVSEPEDRTARRLRLLNDLRECIPRGELVLHYQPKIDLATRRTTGVEALVRWRHPTDGLLMPAQFMDEAERSELIEPLTRWVLDEALQQQRRWRDAGLDLSMAVNISARSLGRGSNLPDIVATLTESWGIVSGQLILELTERAMIDSGVPEVLDLLHAMGERLAVDDFGTGHSSLVYLQRLPIDEIKIDQSFVKNLASAPSDAVIVRSTIDLGRNLGLSVVAEGVEDEAALELLVAYGADTAQGYLFSPPRPADDMTTWLKDSPFGAAVGTTSG